MNVLNKNYEEQYLTIVNEILNEGYYDTNRTGVKTLKVPHKIMSFDLEKEFPILKTKKVAFKTAVKELLWIYKDQSNDVKKLQEENVHIWDEWANEEGTIGKAYGYQVAKYNQIDKLIESLKTNPQDRRMLISLWNIEDLEQMELQPCCFMTLWDVTDGKLNCMLIQRSADVPLGLPFNTTQYAVLVHMIAQVVGLRVGKFTHVINNAHIYENQIEGMKIQIERAKKISEIEIKEKYNKDSLIEEDKEYLEVVKSTPRLLLNKNIKNFYDFTINDINLENYKSLKPIKMPVSV